ncbi:MAG: hypothetical protein AAF402_05555 [Pseudomonadota bacterium]
MKWIAALLMVANVTVFLWFSGRHGNIDSLAVESRPDVNKEGMLLLEEIETEVSDPGSDDGLATAVFDASEITTVSIASSGAEKIATGQSDLVEEGPSESADSVLISLAAPANDSVVGTGAGDDVVSLETESEIQVAALNPPTVGTRDLSCYRIGPFKQIDTWQSENSWMDESGFAFKPVSSESRELRAVRVFLGPFDSKQAAQSTISSLKNTDLDHFVYEIEGGKARISLGYFTQEELAAKFVTHVQGKGFDAQSQPEYRILGPYNWMEASIDSEKRTQIQNRQWSEAEVTVIEVDCADLQSVISS